MRVTEAEGMQFYANISTDSLDWYRNIYIKEAIKTWILHVADVFSDMDIVLKQIYPCIVGRLDHKEASLSCSKNGLHCRRRTR